VESNRVGKQSGPTHAIRLGDHTYWWEVRIIKCKGEKPTTHTSLNKSHWESYTAGLASGAGSRNVVERATWREVLAAIKAGAEPVVWENG
jgi:hypothetical protein